MGKTRIAPLLSDYLLRPGAPGLLEREPETNRELAVELRALLAVARAARRDGYRGAGQCRCSTCLALARLDRVSGVGKGKGTR